MEEGISLGNKTEDVVVRVTKAAQLFKKNKQALFYMPPRIVEEFLSFFEDKNQPFITQLLAQVIIKSPEVHSKTISGEVFYRLIEDIRGRSYRGLRVGEEELVKMGQLMMGNGPLSKKEFEIKTGEVVRKFRERYRQATRVGFLDSLGDLDLIMLARETGGYVVTTDEGVLSWGRIFGVREMPGHVFGELVLRHQE